MNSSQGSKVSHADLAEMTVGAAVLVFPVAITEEVWNLAEQLSWQRVLVLLIASVAILSWYGVHIFHKDDRQINWRRFALRIITVYVLTLTLSAVILIFLDKWPILSDPHIALRRTVIVAFPGVFSATIVDNLR